MGIQIGDIDIVKQGIENEFRIMVLEKILERILNTNQSLSQPSVDEIERIRREMVEVLRTKYPNSGIEFRRG